MLQHESSAHPHAVATCPHCGYDLSGLVAAWAESCPLTGTCSECGCEYRSERIFVRRTPAWWSYEHGPVLSVTRMLWTLVAVAYHPMLWNGVQFSPRLGIERFFVLWGVLALATCSGLALFEFFPDLPGPMWWRGRPVPAGLELQAGSIRLMLSAAVVLTLASTIMAGLMAPHAIGSPGGGVRLVRVWLYSITGIIAISGLAGLLAAAILLVGQDDPDTSLLRAMLGGAALMLPLGTFVWSLTFWNYGVHQHILARPRGLVMFVSGVLSVAGAIAVASVLHRWRYWPV